MLDEIEIDETPEPKKKKRSEPPPPSPDSPKSFSSSELDAAQSRIWPPGVAYDRVHYLGDLDMLQFLSKKIALDGRFPKKWNGNYIRKYGEHILLENDVGKPDETGNKIPNFRLLKMMPKPPMDIHRYIFDVAGVDQYTSTRLLKM